MESLNPAVFENVL